MRILVLLKMVSQLTYSDTIDQELSDERLASGSLTINPADSYALELALRVKDACPETEISVMTMAPESAEKILRNAIAMGADNAYLVTDRMFAGSDTIATSKTLVKAIQSLPSQDFIVCGNKAIDSETGHIGPQLAELLNASLISNVLEFHIDENNLIYSKPNEDHISLNISNTPTVLSVINGVSFIRSPSILGLRKSKNSKINFITGTYLGLSPDICGQNGSETETINITNVCFSHRKTIIETDIDKGTSYVADLILNNVSSLANTCPDDNNLPYIESNLRGNFWLVLENMYSSLGLVLKAKELADEKSLSLRIIEAKYNSDDSYKSILNYLAREYFTYSPEVILFERTHFLADIAPSFAIRIGRGITADCTDLKWDSNYGLLQIRPTFGGKKIAVNISKRKPYIASVRRGVFSSDGSYSLEENSSLETSKIILSCGLGIGSKENCQKTYAFASRLGIACGASRAAVAAGYAPYIHQVGQTGTTVHPELYIALGISGAVQHLSGMISSKKIISVNINPKAQITNYSDYYVVADAYEFIEMLQKKINI